MIKTIKTMTFPVLRWINEYAHIHGNLLINRLYGLFTCNLGQMIELGDKMFYFYSIDEISKVLGSTKNVSAHVRNVGIKYPELTILNVHNQGYLVNANI